MVLLELILYFAAHFVGSLVLPLIFLFAYKLGDSSNLVNNNWQVWISLRLIFPVLYRGVSSATIRV